MNDDFDERVRGLLAGEVGRAPVPPSVASIDSAESPARRRPAPNWAVVSVAAATVLALIGGVGALTNYVKRDDSPGTTPPPGGYSGNWEQVADPPIPPRALTTMVWTGEEVLVLGGDTHRCPEHVECLRPSPTDSPLLADGAAYNPQFDSWRRIASAPQGISGEALPAILGSDVFVFDPGAGYLYGRRSEPAFLRYSILEDRWSRLEAPSGRVADLVVVGQWSDHRPRLLAVRGSDESNDGQDLVYDIDTSRWSPLPDDPLPPMFDRRIVVLDGGLFLFGKPIASVFEGSESPASGARFDIATVEWTELRDPEASVTEGPWIVDGGRIVNPEFMPNWERPDHHASGSIYDPYSDTWTSLPPPATTVRWRSAGAVGGTNSVFFRYSWTLQGTDLGVFDLRSHKWVEIPNLEFAPASVTAAGRDAFAFGGVDWDSPDGVLVDRAYIWRAPESGARPTPSPVPTEPSTTTTPPPTLFPMGEGVLSSQLTQFGGCGDAFFWAATADDTVAITISVDARERPRDAAFERTYDLATDTGITVEVIEGAALSPAFCNHVIDANRHRVDRTEAIAEGIVTVRIDPPPDEFGAFVHGKATLEGGRLADGRPIVPLTVTTDQIGFYAW